MARKLGRQINELTLMDNISNTEVTLFYRAPTVEERIAFSKMSVQRKRNKVTFHSAEARQKFGGEILTGFREGDFMIEREPGSGHYIPISSDKDSSKFYPKWKEYVLEHASDLVQLLGGHIFDTPAEIGDGDEDPPAGNEGPKEGERAE